MERQLSDRVHFQNHKGETYQMSREEFRNMARTKTEVDNTPKFHDTPVPNLQTGLNYVEKANATPDKAFTITHITNEHGRTKEDFR